MAVGRGLVAAQQLTRDGATQTTRLTRDEAGRVIAADVDGAVTRYTYDPAGQLTGLRGPDGATTVYSYDAAGRLVTEETGGDRIVYRWDAAGQLTSRRDGRGVRVYRYDGAGRRVRETGPDGTQRLFGWDGRGNLASITAVGRDGDRRWAHRLASDVLGELAGVDETGLWWDTDAGLPQLIQADTTPVETAAGATGLGGQGWAGPGWGARPTPDADPWAATASTPLGGVDSSAPRTAGQASLQVTAGGQVGVAGRR